MAPAANANGPRDTELLNLHPSFPHDARTRPILADGTRPRVLYYHMMFRKQLANLLGGQKSITLQNWAKVASS